MTDWWRDRARLSDVSSADDFTQLVGTAVDSGSSLSSSSPYRTDLNRRRASRIEERSPMLESFVSLINAAIASLLDFIKRKPWLVSAALFAFVASLPS
jgi:hypothetical protein